jgi:hypothetical protein
MPPKRQAKSAVAPANKPLAIEGQGESQGPVVEESHSVAAPKKRHFGMRKGQKQNRGAVPSLQRPGTHKFLTTIRDDESYTLDQFVQFTGLGPSAIHAAEADGLETVRVGNRKWIIGAKWNEYLRNKLERDKARKTAPAPLPASLLRHARRQKPT